jgi:hypothetical protein
MTGFIGLLDTVRDYTLHYIITSCCFVAATNGRRFSLSSCPQHSLKVLLLLNPTCLLKYVFNCEHDFSYFDPDYLTIGLTVTGLARSYCGSTLS